MKKQIIFIILFVLSGFAGRTQQIPTGECGIVYIHDAAGNRTKRLYYCNNGGVYPSFQNPQEPTADFSKSGNAANTDNDKNIEFARIDAIFPNPTDGKFSITFNKPINTASITIIDINGKVLQSVKASGTKADFDLFHLSSGTYFVRIEEGRNIITKKIVKQ